MPLGEKIWSSNVAVHKAALHSGYAGMGVWQFDRDEVGLSVLVKNANLVDVDGIRVEVEEGTSEVTGRTVGRLSVAMSR